MQTKLKDKIFIQNKDTKRMIELNPKYDDITNETKKFQVILPDEIPEGFKIIKPPHPPKPLNEADEWLYVQSPVFINRYYSIFEWDNEKYYGEIVECMHILSIYMGYKCECEFSVKKYNKLIQNQDVSLSSGANIKHSQKNEAEENNKEIKGEGNIKAEYKKEQTQSLSKSKETGFKSEVKHQLPPDELKKYIEAEKINLTALPAQFKNIVKVYLEVGKRENFESKFIKIEEVSDYMDTSKELSANLKVAEIFKAQFGLNIKDKYEKQEKESSLIAFRLYI